MTQDAAPGPMTMKQEPIQQVKLELNGNVNKTASKLKGNQAKLNWH